MTGPVRRMFPGTLEEVASARAFVRQNIQGCPLADDAILLTSELCTNALQHSRSGNGGAFDVVVYNRPGWLRIDVRDDGPVGAPGRETREDSPENGRGLGIVASLAHSWGQYGDEYGHTIYFELRWITGAPTAELRRLFRNLQALDDAIALRRARLAGRCPACTDDERCDDHGRDVDLIAAYRQDAAVLIAAITEPEEADCRR